MGLLHSLLTCLLLLIANSSCNDFTITPITTSSGLYYEKVGEILLSNNNWQFVTSVDYEGYLLFYEYLFKQANSIREFCETVSFKDCNDRYDTIRSSMNKIADTDEIMANFLGIESRKRRVKRFWQALATIAAPYFLEPLGKSLVGKIFGNMDQPNLEKYDQEIAQLQNNQVDLNNKINMQATMFKIDSERKNFQIKWLQRTQGEIENKIKLLENTVTKDSEQKAKEIKELQDMLTETKEKIRMQAEVQQKLVKDVEDIRNKLKSVNDEISYIKQEVSKNADNINALEVKVKLNTISINFNFLLTQFETEQKKLLDVINNANRGDLDPYIITPLNLIQMLQKVQAIIPEGTKLPFHPVIENAQKLYNMIKPTVYLYNNKIQFILQISLVYTKTFNFHKITSLPVSVGQGKFVFILPKEPYLIVDKTDQEYMLLSSEDFREYCGDIGKSIYLCDQIDQTSLVLLSAADCEIQMFLNAKEIPASCNKRVMYLEKPIFLQLQEPKAWIYAFPNSDVVIFTCHNKRDSISLEGSGIIHANNCSVRTPNYVLVSINRFSKPIVSVFSPLINLTNFIDMDDIENFDTKSPINHKQIITPYELKELEDMSFSVNNISGPSSASMYYGILIAVFIAICGLSLFLLYRKKYYSKVSTTNQEEQTDPLKL